VSTPDCSDLGFGLDRQDAQRPDMGGIQRRVVYRSRRHREHVRPEKPSRGRVQGLEGEDKEAGEWMGCIHHNSTSQ